MIKDQYIVETTTASCLNKLRYGYSLEERIMILVKRTGKAIIVESLLTRTIATQK